MEEIESDRQESKNKAATDFRKRPRSPDRTATAAAVPLRDHSQLFVHPATLACAQGGNNNCLVCAYKIACFDVALDKEFTRRWPNQRPETCPRLLQPKTGNHHTLKSTANVKDWPCWNMRNARILTVGDGDFSYSTALARHFRTAQGLTATSYESKATLQKVYRTETLQLYWDELKEAGASIRFQVDATRLPEDLQDVLWGVVVWNFPCTAVPAGQDGQNQAMEDNKALVTQFCRNIQAHEIHLTHKTKPPYDQWGLVNLVQSVTSPHGSWTYVGRIVLDRAMWQPYVPRKALDQKSFPCHDACTYVFQRSSARPWLETSLIAVTDDCLLKLRDYWLGLPVPEKPKKKQKGRGRR